MVKGWMDMSSHVLKHLVDDLFEIEGLRSDYRIGVDFGSAKNILEIVVILGGDELYGFEMVSLCEAHSPTSFNDEVESLASVPGRWIQDTVEYDQAVDHSPMYTVTSLEWMMEA